VTLTQAELDAKINRAHAKAKSTSEKSSAPGSSGRPSPKPTGSKSRTRPPTVERDEARTEALTARVETTAERLALKAKVDPDRVDRFMRLVDIDVEDLTADGKPDPDAIAAAVKKTLDEFPVLGQSRRREREGRGVGRRLGQGGTGTKTFTRAQIAEMTPAEFEKNETAIMAQMQAGALKN